MGVAVRRYIDFLIILLIPAPRVLPLCLQQHPYFLFIFKMFFSFLFMIFLCHLANVPQRTFKILQKSRSREHGDIIISTRPYVDCVRMQVLRLPHASYRVTFQENCS